MALSDIIESIQKETQEKIDKLKKAAEENKRRLIQEWEEKIRNERDALLKKAKKNAEKKIQQAHFLLHSQEQSRILKKKREVIEEIIEEAKKRLADIDQARYRQLMERLVAKLPNISGELISTADAEKRNVLKQIIENHPQYRLSEETIPASGGFIFRSDYLEIDNTFESLLNAVSDEITLHVAKILFSQNP